MTHFRLLGKENVVILDAGNYIKGKSSNISLFFIIVDTLYFSLCFLCFIIILSCHYVTTMYLALFHIVITVECSLIIKYVLICLRWCPIFVYCSFISKIVAYILSLTFVLPLHSNGYFVIIIINFYFPAAMSINGKNGFYDGLLLPSYVIYWSLFLYII